MSQVMPSAPVEGHEEVDCGIVIVTFNSGQYIKTLLESIPAASGGLSTRCVVVDNGSQDDTLSILRARKDVTVVEAGGNFGYSGGINIGRSAVGSCSTLLVLNPDLCLEPDALLDLYLATKDPGVGVAVPKLLNDDGSLFHSLRREPSVLSTLGDAVFGSHWPGRPRYLSETIRSAPEYSRAHDVEWACGACILISADCNAAVGDWDEDRFFLYSEETDFAARARRTGFRIRYVPSARACHKAGGSGRSSNLYALMTVNKIRYFEKYHGRAASTAFRWILVFHHILRFREADMRDALRILLKRSTWERLPHSDDRKSDVVVTL